VCAAERSDAAHNRLRCCWCCSRTDEPIERGQPRAREYARKWRRRGGSAGASAGFEYRGAARVSRLQMPRFCEAAPVLDAAFTTPRPAGNPAAQLGSRLSRRRACAAEPQGRRSPAHSGRSEEIPPLTDSEPPRRLNACSFPTSPSGSRSIALDTRSRSFRGSPSATSNQPGGSRSADSLSQRFPLAVAQSTPGSERAALIAARSSSERASSSSSVASSRATTGS
jgi:hypothetical protein